MNKINWAIDPTHSEIGFKIKHMMFTNVSGKFDNFNVEVQSDDDNFSNANIAFNANIDSINTNNPDRDNHLKSAEFFDAEKFPNLSFKSTSLEPVGDGKYKVNGELTIRDVTKPVVLDAEYSGLMKDPWGNTRAGFAIDGKINRKDFGLTWNATLESGGLLVGEDVKLHSEVQLIKQ